MSEKPKYIQLSWDNVHHAVHVMVEEMRAREYKPDFIVGIARGGAIPAVMLSHALEVPLVIVHWNTRDLGIVDRESNLWIPLEINEGKKALVVDDIVDSGLTLDELFADWNRSLGTEALKQANIAVAALVANDIQNIYVDYAYLSIDRNQDDRWVVLPWEKKKED